MKISLVDANSVIRRAELSRERIQLEAQIEKEQKRADRRMGKLPRDVRDRLRNCTIPALLKAKRLCDKFINDQRNPPPLADCVKPYTVKVLFSVTVLNRRYQFEIVRSSKRTVRLYLNGPYMRAYWRDGRIIQRRHFKKKDYRIALPRKVKTALKEYGATHNLREELEKAIAEYI